jgi:pimeloyl-ACP methyl ester carboxylesterase
MTGGVGARGRLIMRRLVPLLALALIAGGGFLSERAVPAVPMAAPPDLLDAGPQVPELRWTPCGDGMECATAAVPLDYSRPHGDAVNLALLRLPATDPKRRIGSLFVNPGGPGDGGVAFVRRYGREVYSSQLRARFDIVGFDPRFVGNSRPRATCLTDDEYAAIFGKLPPFPVTSTQERAMAAANATFSQLCAKRSPHLAHASTANVARDLDLLRQAVGEDRVTFVGYSYGSVLGQTYATLYPRRIRAMVLDGVIDAQAWSTGNSIERHLPVGVRVDSAVGTAETFEAFLRRCRAAGRERCAFAAGGDPRDKFEPLTERLLRGPLVVGDDAIGYAQLVDYVSLMLPFAQEWDDLGAHLQAIFGDAFGDQSARPAAAAVQDLLQRAARSARWAPVADAPDDTRLAAGMATTCADTVNPEPFLDWSTAAEAEDNRARYFGRLWAWSAQACATWRLFDNARDLGPYTPSTSAPLLMIGNRFDPATSYSGALVVSRAFKGSRLLTVSGYGHTSLVAPSACSRDALDTYLIYIELPPEGTVCEPDTGPFSGS